MVAGRMLFIAAVAGLLACQGPPNSVQVEPLVFTPEYDDLPALTDLCSRRGRLFAVGRREGAGVFFEERSTGLSEVALELEVDLPVTALSACWQTETAEVFAVGGSQVLVRAPDGEYSVADLSEVVEGNVELFDIESSSGLGPLAVGSVDGAGALFELAGEAGWRRVDLGETTLPPLIRLAINDSTAYVVGQGGELLRWRPGLVDRLFSLNDRLSGVVASGTDVLVFAFDGTILRIDGNDLVPFAELEARWLDGGFTAGGDLWMAGRGGIVTRHLRKPSSQLGPTPRQAVFPDETDIIAVEPGRDRLLILAVDSQAAQVWSLDAGGEP